MLSFRPGESNRWLSVQTFLDRSIDHALVAWQSGILQSQGARFCMLPLPTKEANRRFSVQLPSDCSIGHALIAWQSDILQSWDARFCMLSFRPRKLIVDSASSPPQTAA